jgi:PAS domain S-box-containing protein
MKDEDKAKEQLINGLRQLRQRIAALEASEAERKRAEEALKAEKEFTEAALNSQTDTFFVFEPSTGKALRWNKAFNRVSGYSDEEIRSMKAPDSYYNEEDLKKAALATEKVFNEGIATVELSLITKDGRSIPTEYTGSFIKDHEGNPRYIIAVGRDITDRKRAEEVLQKRTRDLGERVKELNCLYGISHLVEKQDISLEEILQGTVDLIPPSWQYPEVTCARIILEGREFTTENFQETTWKQTNDIIVRGDRTGVLEVCYLEEKPESDEGPFLKEEGRLIDAIAKRLGHILERVKAEEELKRELDVNAALSELYKPLISPWASIKEIASTILGKAKSVTGSEHGYVSAIDPTSGDNVGHTLTEMLKDQCSVTTEKRIAFPRGEDGLYHGLWGHSLNSLEAFFTNSPEKHQASTGIPEGHIHIHRFLSVPVTLGEELVGQIALANKDDDYTEGDLKAICRMAEFYALAIQRNRAEEALRESEERFRQLSENVQDAFWLGTAGEGDRGEILYVNPAFEEIFGIKTEEIYKSDNAWLEMLHEDDRDWVLEALEEFVQGRGEYDVEYRIVRDQGAVRWIWAKGFPIRNEKGEIVRTAGIGQDITERKRAEAQIIRAKQEWERTFDAVPDLIMILDNEYRVVRVNKAMAGRLGCTPKDLVGQICYDVFHGTEKPTAHCPHARLMADGLAHSAEVHEDRLGGDFLVSVNPLHDPDGKLAGSVHVARDITERKQAEEALQKARDELERRVEERTAELKQEIKERKQTEEALRESESHLRYLSSQLLTAQENERKKIARELHDSIGQSLSALKFSVENRLRQVGGNNSEKSAQALEAIVPVIQKSIEEVRKIAMDLRPSVLDDLGILATISWFCREFQSIYSGIRIEQQINIQEDDVPDPLKTVIYRVSQEALNNVAKHSKADLVRLSLRKTDGAIELAIEDNGLGFDLKDLLSVEGIKTGLGLASMKERAELSGGSFTIESGKGTGTTVRATWKQ